MVVVVVVVVVVVAVVICKILGRKPLTTEGIHDDQMTQ